jgi:hypothetical protein
MNLERIFESKRAFRKALASRPIVEKLRMLDELRERQLAIRGERNEAKGNSAFERRQQRKPGQ